MEVLKKANLLNLLISANKCSAVNCTGVALFVPTRGTLTRLFAIINHYFGSASQRFEKITLFCIKPVRNNGSSERGIYAIFKLCLAIRVSSFLLFERSVSYLRWVFDQYDFVLKCVYKVRCTSLYKIYSIHTLYLYIIEGTLRRRCSVQYFLCYHMCLSDFKYIFLIFEVFVER